MAESIKLTVPREGRDRDTSIDSLDSASTIAARPAWMPTGESVTTPPQSDAQSSPTKAIILHPKEEADEQKIAIGERMSGWLRTAAAAGYGLSLLLHAFLMLVMALWFFPQIKEAMSITTVVQSDTEEPQHFDAMDDVHLQSPAGSQEVLVPQLTEAINDADLNLLEAKFLQDVTAAESQGDGGSSGVGSGGFRLLEPRNAVKAGSFTAWTIPIAQIPGEKTTAGDSPRPGQDYHIVIQVKVPTNRDVYNIADLSGKVIGTDGYVQVIPAQAYFQDKDGNMIRAKIGRRLPIVEGVVQIIIRVPGAEALVKDTIQIKSKLLKEDQTLELIFGKERRLD